MSRECHAKTHMPQNHSLAYAGHSRHSSFRTQGQDQGPSLFAGAGRRVPCPKEWVSGSRTCLVMASVGCPRARQSSVAARLGSRSRDLSISLSAVMNTASETTFLSSRHRCRGLAKIVDCRSNRRFWRLPPPAQEALSELPITVGPCDLCHSSTPVTEVFGATTVSGCRKGCLATRGASRRPLFAPLVIALQDASRACARAAFIIRESSHSQP